MPKKLKKDKLYTYKCKLSKYRFKDRIERFNNDYRECPNCHNMAVILKHGYIVAQHLFGIVVGELINP